MKMLQCKENKESCEGANPFRRAASCPSFRGFTRLLVALRGRPLVCVACPGGSATQTHQGFSHFGIVFFGVCAILGAWLYHQTRFLLLFCVSVAACAVALFVCVCRHVYQLFGFRACTAFARFVLSLEHLSRESRGFLLA